MSQDVIGGIAVMQRSRFDGVWRIWLRLYCSNGHNHQTGLCFSEGRDEPPGLCEKVGEPIWQFVRNQPRHGWLDCKPSVREMSTDAKGNPVEQFHNTGNWQVQYVEMRQPEPESEDVERWARGHTVHYDLNNPSLSDAQRAELFEELRQSGIIY